MSRRIIALSLLFTLLFLLPLGAAAEVIAPKYVLPITGIALNRTSAGLFAGTTGTLVAKVQPASRAHEAVTWAVDDPGVASVEGGVITAHAPGRTWVTASVTDTDGQVYSAQCALTVKAAAVTSFRLSDASIALGQGDTFALSVSKFLPDHAYDKTITWKSQNPAIASVDASTGVVTALSLGTTRIRATAASGRIQTCTVTVSGEVRARALKLTPTAKVLSHGQSFALAAAVVPSNAIASDQVISWSSSNSAVASVDASGVVTAGQASGKCVITGVTANGRKASCAITVKFVATKSVTLSETQIKLPAGQSRQLTASVLPAGASNRDPAWASDNHAVATVEGGLITAHAPGVATITASAGGKRATCRVIVPSSQVQSVTITATGDITIGGDPRRSAAAPGSEAYYEALYQKYSGDFLGDVSSAFDAANEITLINLESTFTTRSNGAKKTYTLRAKPAFAEILSRAGVDVVSHANNHSMDFGAVGMRNTRAAVTGYNMNYCTNGTYTTQTVNGVVVGFCAFNQTGGSVTNAMKAAIKSLKARCDIVVVSLHWGTEFQYSTTATQRNLGRSAVLAGADLVVGHHPHVVQGIEQYKGKYIVYSLGTLSSSLLTPVDMDTFLFQQTFAVDSVSGLVESASVKLIPCSMSRDDQTNDARPYITSGAARKRTLNKIKYHSRAFSETVPAACFE